MSTNKKTSKGFSGNGGPLFDEVFRETVRNLAIDAESAGTNLTQVCKETKISRSTPERWKGKKVPKSVQIVADMQRAVRRRASSSAKAASK